MAIDILIIKWYKLAVFFVAFLVPLVACVQTSIVLRP